MVELSLIVPMYNEEEVCAEFFRVVVPIIEDIADSYEILCVDDGSSDGTVEALDKLRKSNPSIKILCLSRNFGKEAALTAGLDFATGKAVIPIDADLQDPPELIREMVEKWRNGAEVVLARRADRASDSIMKRTTSHLFYRLISKISKPDIPENVGDFRLMDRMVVEALKQLPERARFMKGLFAWVGYKTEIIDYVRVPRTAGDTKFNYLKLWNFGLEGIASFTSLPLKVWSYFGVFISFLGVCYMLFLVIRTLITGIDTPGYASLMSVQLFFNGILLLSLGAIGEYLSRIFIETKQRPVYLVRRAEGVLPGKSEVRDQSLQTCGR
nr:glycosyltransferase family 2 protein [uncultured Hyphomonas sp.]